MLWGMTSASLPGSSHGLRVPPGKGRGLAEGGGQGFGPGRRESDSRPSVHQGCRRGVGGVRSLLGREEGTCSADRFTAGSGGPHEYMVAQAFLTEPIRWAHLYLCSFRMPTLGRMAEAGGPAWSLQGAWRRAFRKNNPYESSEKAEKFSSVNRTICSRKTSSLLVAILDASLSSKAWA